MIHYVMIGVFFYMFYVLYIYMNQTADSDRSSLAKGQYQLCKQIHQSNPILYYFSHSEM